jgi:large subunit ribosomal protein L25
MAESQEISAEMRGGTGTGAAREVRRQSRVPGVVYVGGEQPVAISVGRRDLDKALLRGGFLNTVYQLKLDGHAIRVLPRDVQHHVVSDAPLHVDFMRLAKDARVTVMVPVHFINQDKSRGLSLGGVLNVVRHEIELSCPADFIPEFLEIDLEGREIGDSIHISAVKLPEGSRPTITDRDFTVATVAPPTVQTEEAPAAEAAAAPEAAAGAAPAAGEKKE